MDMADAKQEDFTDSQDMAREGSPVCAFMLGADTKIFEKLAKDSEKNRIIGRNIGTTQNDDKGVQYTKKKTGNWNQGTWYIWYGPPQTAPWVR